MKKKLDLPEALKQRMVGEKVTVFLDTDIASLTLGVLMGLDDIGAVFVVEVPDETIPKPAITIEQMEGEILESPPPASQKKPRKNKPIDVGKVRALRAAGWTLKAIAEEMGCSFQNISMILNKEKSDGQKEK